jgi:hypothetical protein
LKVTENGVAAGGYGKGVEGGEGHPNTGGLGVGVGATGVDGDVEQLQKTVVSRIATALRTEYNLI